MKRLFSVLLCLVLIVGLMAGCGSQSNTDSSSNTDDTSNQATQEKYKIVLITMDSMDRHWVSVDKGARKAVEELGNIDYKWMAPDKKDDAQQIERVNNAVADGADAIIIAANGPDAVVAALEEAKASGVKIVYVDSPANTEAYATFATDNYAAGKKAGEEMLKALGAAGITSGKIGIVNVNSATASTVAREKGFREIVEAKGFTVLPTQYGEGDPVKSQDIADNYITDGVVGIFGANEGSSVGVGNAIKASGKKDIIGVGFDKSDAILSLVKDGWLYCTIVQNPEVMGYEGVKAAVKAIKGEKIDNPNVDTGSSVITKDNADSVE